MKAKIQQIGESLTICIPPEFADQLGVKDASEVDLSMEREELVIRATQSRRLSLSELLARVTEDNIPPLVSFGQPVGREEW